MKPTFLDGRDYPDEKRARHGQRRPPGAFTLLELLVVIAIIANLASMLMPALSKAKAKAQSTACANNRSQLQKAWIMYTAEDGDWIPLNRVVNQGGFFFADKGSWVVGNAWLDVNPSNIMAGLLYPFVNSVRVYRCPSDRSKVRNHPRVAENAELLRQPVAKRFGWSRRF